MFQRRVARIAFILWFTVLSNKKKLGRCEWDHPYVLQAHCTPISLSNPIPNMGQGIY